MATGPTAHPTLTVRTAADQGVAVGHELSNTDPALRRCWHPVARTAEVNEQPFGVSLLGEPWVLHRSGGDVVAFADRCPHRGCPLTLGHCEGGVLRSRITAGASTGAGAA